MRQKIFIQKNGFTLIEIIIVMALLTFLTASTYNTFLAGQSFWLRIGNSMELEDDLRKAFDRIVPEIAMSGHDKNGVFQVSINDNGGINSSDIIKFSIPVICENGGNAVDAEGNTAHWGASLNWGCSQSTCTDTDNNCETIEYKYIEYSLNTKNVLLRRVLDYNQEPIHEDVIAQNIKDIQAEINFNQRIVSIKVTAELPLTRKTKTTASSQTDVFLRNAH